jgi:hypothetical protein
LGYWLVATDGGIFAFGDANFFGSTGAMVLNKPVVGMAPMPDGLGYWLVATDGGIFAFGSAATHFYGSLGGRAQTYPIVSIAALPTNGGYWMANANGAVTSFGSAIYWGSAPQHLNKPVVSITATKGTGRATNTSFQSGAYGYDISKWQCGHFPPNPYSIGIVEVEGYMKSPTPKTTQTINTANTCLKTEMTWGGGGLNLYDFMSFGTTTTSADINCASVSHPNACNFGYNHAIASYNKAKATGINVTVPWWLDIEPGGFNSTNHGTTPTANASEVQGAFDALRYSEGLNSVGFYFSVLKWKTLLGSYNPSGPLWVAWWTTRTPALFCTAARPFAKTHNQTLPADPIELIQYSDNVGGYDGDYAC